MSRFFQFPRMLTLVCAAILSTASVVQAQEQTWKFITFGDSLSFDFSVPVNTNILSELAQEIVAQDPAFLLYLGDFSLHDTAPEFELWTNAMAPVFNAGIPMYPVIGNHDYTSIPVISNLFGAWLPNNGPVGEESSTFALSYSNAVILCLNEFAPTNQYQINQPWVDAVLATNTRPHVFAAGHMPAFKIYHDDCLGAFPRERDRFWNSLSNAGARIYLSGHDHFFDHSRLDDRDGIPENDVHQLVVGTGGAPLYPLDLFDGDNGIWIPVRESHEAQYGYLVVEITGETVSCTWHHRVAPGLYSRTPEVFSYTVDPRPLLHSRYEAGRLTLTWTGAATLQAAPECFGSFTNVPGATSPFVITDLVGARMFYRLSQPLN